MRDEPTNFLRISVFGLSDLQLVGKIDLIDLIGLADNSNIF